MQTFLPELDFDQSAIVLDNKRLNKQVVEASQIIDILKGRPQKNGKPRSKTWIHHPAVLMWKGYEPVLINYYNAMLARALERGTKFEKLKFEQSEPFIDLPFWMKNNSIYSHLILTHRSNLLRKDYNHYSQFWTDISPNLDYYWPVRIVKGKIKELSPNL